MECSEWDKRYLIAVPHRTERRIRYCKSRFLLRRRNFGFRVEWQNENRPMIGEFEQMSCRR